MESKFNQLINGKIPVLVDFHAEWCGPCKTMSPMIKELASEMGDKAVILKVDVDKNAAASATYNIQGVPTFIIFQNGEIKWRQSGALPKQILLEALNKYVV